MSECGRRARAYQTYFADLAMRLKQAFTRGRLAQIEAAARRTPLAPGMPAPIFIVGFPRSGTTLVEQMLSAHSGISAGDELQHVWRLTQLAAHMCGSAAPYPECLANLALPEHSKSIDKFRSFYISNVELRRIVEKGKRRFTDKMPLNETHLGLIRLVFPEMPIVHLVRHPLDVVLSAYFNDLTHGGNCAYGLETAARHYALVFDLIRHYRAELDLNYHAVRYEGLVDEPEPNLRTLLEFLSEPWEVLPRIHENCKRGAPWLCAGKEPLYRRSRSYRNYRGRSGRSAHSPAKRSASEWRAPEFAPLRDQGWGEASGRLKSICHRSKPRGPLPRKVQPSQASSRRPLLRESLGFSATRTMPFTGSPARCSALSVATAWRSIATLSPSLRSCNRANWR
jgi:hypothetical protein